MVSTCMLMQSGTTFARAGRSPMRSAISIRPSHSTLESSAGTHSVAISALSGHQRPPTLEVAGTPARRMRSRAKALKPTDP